MIAAGQDNDRELFSVKMNLPHLNLLYLTFRLEASAPVVLPPFLGSTLRGAFGSALKQFFCFVPHGDCRRCWFFEACPYQSIFESPNLVDDKNNHPKLRGQKSLPHPFVLVPPPPRRKFPANRENIVSNIPNFNNAYCSNHLDAGDYLQFSILLIGTAATFWAQILTAVRLAAENGLGENRIPFRLRQAFANDGQGQPVKVYDDEKARITIAGAAPVTLDRLAAARADALAGMIVQSGNQNLSIEFQTPARIRIADRLGRQIGLPDFLKKVTERIEFLARLYAQPPQTIDFREFIAAAAQSSAVSQLQTHTFEQYSNRQRGKTARPVETGSLIFSGTDLIKYLPVLTAGEILHVGTNTSDGFGRYLITLQN